MNIYVVLNGSDDQMSNLSWQKAQGTSLSTAIHESLDQGNIVMVDKYPAKVKFFKKDDGVLKSLLVIPEHTISTILSNHFGQDARIEEIQLQEA